MKDLIYSTRTDLREVLIYTPEEEKEFNACKLQAEIRLFTNRIGFFQQKERNSPILHKKEQYNVL